MPYTSINFIGHCLYSTFDPANEHGNPDGKFSYTGENKDVDDINSRVDLISVVYNAAKAQITPEDDTLNVLVWPENFFVGRHGFYSKENFMHLKDKLEDFVKKTAEANWLFVFGTTNAGERDCISIQCMMMLKDAEGKIHKKILEKEQFSKNLIKSADIRGENDGNTAYDTGARPYVLADISKISPSDGLSGWTIDGKCRWSVCGMNLSIEICADHGSFRSRKEDIQQEVDIQIVLSAGTVASPRGICARQGGIVLVCDGDSCNVSMFTSPVEAEFVVWGDGERRENFQTQVSQTFSPYNDAISNSCMKRRTYIESKIVEKSEAARDTIPANSTSNQVSDRTNATASPIVIAKGEIADSVFLSRQEIDNMLPLKEALRSICNDGSFYVRIPYTQALSVIDYNVKTSDTAQEERRKALFPIEAEKQRHPINAEESFNKIFRKGIGLLHIYRQIPIR